MKQKIAKKKKVYCLLLTFFNSLLTDYTLCKTYAQVESILKQYNQFVKPSYDQFIKSTINLADLIVNGSVNN